VLLVADSLHLVDGGETALADLLHWLVVPVEPKLVEVTGQVFNPEFSEGLALGVELDLSRILLDDPEADWSGHDCLFGSALSVKFVDGLKLEVEGELRFVEVFRVGLVGLEDG
jgi:hypothetical protein